MQNGEIMFIYTAGTSAMGTIVSQELPQELWELHTEYVTQFRHLKLLTWNALKISS
jgi:hypothetical protein